MSAITLKNNAVMYKESKKTLKERIAEYFAENQKTIILGLYAISGTMTDAVTLRALDLI